MALSWPVVADMVILLIWLLALMPGLPVNAFDVIQRPGTTCGVKGNDAHLVWVYNDSADALDLIRWFDGTDADPAMGAYDAKADTFAAFGPYIGNIRFSMTSSASLNKGILTFINSTDTDEGTYTTRFEATSDIDDISILEVAEASDLLGWDICVDGTCNAISDPLTLSPSAVVKVKFTKGGGLTSDMDIDVAPSVGDDFVLVVPAGTGTTAEHALAISATLLAAGSLSIDLAFGKNGEVFYNHAIPAVSVVSDNTTTGTSPDTPGDPNTWNDLYVIPIVLGVCILVIIIVVVVVVRRRKQMETGRPHPQDRSSGVSVGASAAGMPPGGQPRPKSQPNPQSGAPSGDMAYKVGYVDPDAPALYHDDRYESGFGNTGYSH